MSTKAFYASLFAYIAVILISHSLLCEGSRRVRGRYYPEEPPVKTLVLENGDVVDCVDFYSQPAMSHPHVRKLYKYELQSRARLPPQETITEIESHGSLSDNIRGIGLRKGSCPPGSVPFLKATKSGLLNYSAIDDFARSRAKRSNSIMLLMDGDHDDPNDHEHATVEASEGSYGGAKGRFNAWKPTVEHQTEASISQLWMVRRYDDGTFATLETGWMVYADLFGDYNVRFFCYTTPDNYTTQLYNIDQRKPHQNNLVFNQVSQRVFPGGELRTTSVYGGHQKDVELEIKKDLETGNWNLLFNGETVGYWLKENYDPDFELADEIQWGGEVFNKRTRGRHTSTQMGNGHFGTEGIGKAAYIRNMEVYDSDLDSYDAPFPLELHVTEPFCYDVKDWNKVPNRGRMITFGGPGFNGLLCR